MKKFFVILTKTMDMAEEKHQQTWRQVSINWDNIEREMKTAIKWWKMTSNALIYMKFNLRIRNYIFLIFELQNYYIKEQRIIVHFSSKFMYLWKFLDETLHSASTPLVADLLYWWKILSSSSLVFLF
jgi:hypothetical protein